MTLRKIALHVHCTGVHETELQIDNIVLFER